MRRRIGVSAQGGFATLFAGTLRPESAQSASRKQLRGSAVGLSWRGCSGRSLDFPNAEVRLRFVHVLCLFACVWAVIVSRKQAQLDSGGSQRPHVAARSRRAVMRASENSCGNSWLGIAVGGPGFQLALREFQVALRRYSSVRTVSCGSVVFAFWPCSRAAMGQASCSDVFKAGLRNHG